MSENNTKFFKTLRLGGNHENRLVWRPFFRFCVYDIIVYPIQSRIRNSLTWISDPIWKDFKDTTDYLNKTQFSDISEENVFVTTDITSLYINNPYQKGIGQGDNNHPYTFHKILSWTIWPCFKFNTFMIKGKHYTQT